MWSQLHERVVHLMPRNRCPTSADSIRELQRQQRQSFSRDRSDEQVRLRGLQRWNQVCAVVHNTDIRIDLERNGDVMINVVAKAGNVSWHPASVAVDGTKLSVRVDGNPASI